MSVYRKYFDKTKCMSVLIKNKKLLEKYNEVWKKVGSITKKEFYRNPVDSEKHKNLNKII